MPDSGLRLLAQAGLSFADRVVFLSRAGNALEVAEALRAGARWLHAFDSEAALPTAERLLFALGCTRFSLVALPDAASSVRLPPHLHGNEARGSLLRYRARPEESEWVSAALDLPWQYMLYEHHPKSEPLSARLDALAGRLPIRLVV